MTLCIEAGRRRRDVAITQMRPVIQQMVKHHFRKTDGLVKTVQAAVGGIGGSFQLSPGQRSHFVMAVVDAFFRQPPLFVTADAPCPQKSECAVFERIGVTECLLASK